MTKSAESQVAERRLRPIYDWLDNCNNKKALQEAEKVLKKQPEFQCCKVLKCLALIRLGRGDEAEIILQKVLDECPTDDGVLQAMTIAWRELHHPEKVCLMYEKAVSKEPQNEDFLSHLFMSYVRMGEYKKQQKVAMDLFKVANKNPYYYWSVMSLVLQALADEKLGKTVQLPLALRMLEKMEREGRVEQEQEIMLLCLVLEMSEDWSAGVKLLQGHLGHKLAQSGGYKTFFNSKSLEWQQKLENWSEVVRLSRAELDKMPDQWSAWTQYIHASVEMFKQNNDHSTIQEVGEFIKTMQSEHNNSRGPWLAELELRACLEQVSSIPELIVQFFNKFGSKLVAYSDIIKYLDIVDSEQRRNVFNMIKSVERDSVKSQSDICRDINICQLNRYCGNHTDLSVEQSLAEVDTLVERFLSVQHLVQEMLVTDIRPSDEYLLMVSHLLWTLWTQTTEDKYYLRSVVILYWGLSLSPSNWQMKLMLIRLLTSAGCGGYAHEVYTKLDVKHLMLDSLGWVLQHQLVQSGHLQLATEDHPSIMRLYTQVNKDTGDHMITAFRTGTFYQIRDIFKLKQRILQSYNNMSSSTEYSLYCLLHKTSSHSDTLAKLDYLEISDDDDWESKRDNRDLETMVTWDPASSRNSAWRQASLRSELLYSRTRQLIVLCVQSCLSVSGSNITSNIASVNGDASNGVQKYLEKLKTHWSVVQSETLESQSTLPQSPAAPNISQYKRSHQVESIIVLVDIVDKLYSGSSDVNIDEAVNTITQLSDQLDILSEKVSTSSLHLLRRRELLASSVWTLEAVGLCCVVTGVMVTIMRGSPVNTREVKKNKKSGKVLPQFSQYVESFNNLLDKLTSVDVKLEDVINMMEANCSLASVSDRLQELNFQECSTLEQSDYLQKETKEVFSKMENSYKDSFSQIKDALKQKKNYLRSMKL